MWGDLDCSSCMNLNTRLRAATNLYLNPMTMRSEQIGASDLLRIDTSIFEFVVGRVADLKGASAEYLHVCKELIAKQMLHFLGVLIVPFSEKVCDIVPVISLFGFVVRKRVVLERVHAVSLYTELCHASHFNNQPPKHYKV